MRNTITENGIEYRLAGDYCLPNLTLPEEPKAEEKMEWVSRMTNS